MLPAINQLPGTSSELPLFHPRPTENRLNPLLAKVIVEDNRLFVELFNKKRVAIQHTQNDFNISIKVQHPHGTDVACLINNQEFCKATGIDSKKVSLLLKREHLGLFLDCMRELPGAPEDQLDKLLQNKIAGRIKSETRGLIKKKDFCFILNECQRSENQKKWSLELSQAKELNDRVKYIVLSILTPKGMRYKVEYRNNNNFHLRLKKNIKKGASNVISLHVDLYSGHLIAKNKLLLNLYLANLQNRRYNTRGSFIELANICMRLNRIPGVIPFVKAHEFSSNGTKGYFFTAYCPQGDLFDYTLTSTVTPKQFQWMKDLCLIVDEIHQNGIIHRDIKPENIFLKNDKIFVGDLELAEEQKMVTRVKKGTLYYVDPELIISLQKNIIEEQNRPSVDIFAVGAVAFITIFQKELPWSVYLDNKQLSMALREMKSIKRDPDIAEIDVRLSKVLLGLLSFESSTRMPLKEAAEIFDDLYHNPPDLRLLNSRHLR